MTSKNQSWHQTTYFPLHSKKKTQKTFSSLWNCSFSSQRSLISRILEVSLWTHQKKGVPTPQNRNIPFCAIFLFHLYQCLPIILLSAFSRHLSSFSHHPSFSSSPSSETDFWPIVRLFFDAPCGDRDYILGLAFFSVLLSFIFILVPLLYDSLRLGQESAFSPST